ncbi:hypothetical protein SAMN05216337_10042 [Bradyrhizobium brasilense]|uniref:Uncharacterized protein n=1 Tax=Bradyrhizobium brasilense TaxID=1419277 RepID=A0A1G6N4W0_9BRAD|nr:hypothetical protein SAMN05216337_10042 [Bradyrhizobium brasilense]
MGSPKRALRGRGVSDKGYRSRPTASCAAFTNVVLAKARTHMWTAPVAQELFGEIGSLASICPACWVRSNRSLAKMVCAMRVPNNHAAF